MRRALATILGVARHLPSSREASLHAVERGQITAAELEKSRFSAVQVEDTLFPADMAANVARELTRSRRSDELRWCLYSHIHYQGQPALWSPASYIVETIGMQAATGLNIRQGCNAAMISMEIACSLLASEPGKTALCLAADRFNISGFDRWNADYGIAYGDGAAGILLGSSDRPEAVADILAIRTTNAPFLERMHRHRLPMNEGEVAPYDIRATKKQFLTEQGTSTLTSATRTALASLWAGVQRDAGVRPEEIRHLVLPHLGYTLLTENYTPVFDLPNATTNLEEGLTVGHLGCADAFHGLTSLIESRPAPESLALLVGAGAGFSWSLCLVRFRQ
jgi:3-oxoacyl-[acyl-carrier-protein] synthase-3